MNSDHLVQLLQRGFRVTLGATASLIEILQDPDKREHNLAQLRTELSQLSEEWAEKGAITEQEARSFVDTLLSQRNNQTPTGGTSPSSTATATSAPPNVQLELQELTAQIAAIRAELEKLRNPDSTP